MAQSLGRVLLHLIWSTKNREGLIGENLAERLHGYLAGTFAGMWCPSLQVGGAPDHVHALVLLGRTITIADLVRDAKLAGHKWMKGQGQKLFAWQAGYGAFSVSESRVAEVVAYIQNQKEHHHAVSFQEEYRLFLQRHQIEYDERYVWE